MCLLGEVEKENNLKGIIYYVCLLVYFGLCYVISYRFIRLGIIYVNGKKNIVYLVVCFNVNIFC